MVEQQQTSPFTSTLRIPALQRFNQEVIDKFKALRFEDSSYIYQGLQLYAVVSDLVCPEAESPRRLIEKFWRPILLNDDVDIERIKSIYAASGYRDVLFSHALRETIEAGSGCDAAYRLLNWFADQYYHEFSISTIQSQQLDGSVKEYYKELQVSIAFERFIVSLISHSLWDPNVEILAIIKERFQPFILKDIE